MAQSGDIGIDLGTSNVVIYMKGRGIVFREPSVVAIERESRQIIAFGTEAYRMIGRTPSNISIIRPLAQGEILDFDLTSSMLRYYITNVIGKRFFARPRAIMSVPSSVKELEKKALITSLFDAGLRRTQILDRVIAAALGAQLNFLGSYGSMVADLSAGGTDLAVLCNGAVSVVSSVPVGGDHFDDSIIRFLRKKYNLLIGERTAEQVKITLGGAVCRDPKVTMDITGRNLISGLPKTISIDSDEIYEALIDNVNDLIESVQAVIERTPPQLASDILEGGVTLTGGAAALYGLSEAIEDVIRIPCRVAQDARDCVVLGCAKVLMNPTGMRHLLSAS
ncbi:MAG: rod shape-determining protein [Clostridia bacterium]|nr:rod shape-determining protein [Clostridia bacterium]